MSKSCFPDLFIGLRNTHIRDGRDIGRYQPEKKGFLEGIVDLVMVAAKNPR